MKFSTIFSVFLAALSVGVSASPIGTNEVREVDTFNSSPQEFDASEFDSEDYDYDDDLGEDYDPSLEKRNDKDSYEYKLLAAAHSGLKADKTYAFTLKWTKGASPGETEKNEDIKTIQKKYGFDHTAIAIVKITGDDKKGHKVSGQYHHLVIKNNDMDTEYDKKNFKKEYLGKSALKIEFVKEVSSKKEKKALTEAKDYPKDKKWKGGETDCKTFVDAVKHEL
ncbi:hypothetical protein MW887_003418 [Aspergillus wentii]|nr:hypothetical protein MW887_003418 [Aspergillus wentii]